MKFVNSFPKVFSGTVVPAPGGGLCGAGSPCTHQCRRSALHPGDFLPDEKVTKESPGAAPLGTRWCEISALFALAALSSGSRRAGFCHRKRPICHFEVVGESVLFFSLVLRRKDFVLLIRGAGGWVARLGATLGLNGGIGEGVLRRRAGVLCSSVQQQMA